MVSRNKHKRYHSAIMRMEENRDSVGQHPDRPYPFGFGDTAEIFDI